MPHKEYHESADKSSKYSMKKAEQNPKTGSILKKTEIFCCNPPEAGLYCDYCIEMIVIRES